MNKLRVARVQRQLRRLEAHARRRGLPKLAENVAAIRRCAPVLCAHWSPGYLRQQANHARSGARSIHTGERRAERRSYPQAAHVLDRAADALDELLHAYRVELVTSTEWDRGCDGCGIDTETHYYLTGSAGASALCRSCMRGFAAHAQRSP